MVEGADITEKDIKEIEDVQKAGKVLLDDATLQDIANDWIKGYDAELEAIAEQANAVALELLEEESDSDEQ